MLPRCTTTVPPDPDEKPLTRSRTPSSSKSADARAKGFPGEPPPDTASNEYPSHNDTAVFAEGARMANAPCALPAAQDGLTAGLAAACCASADPASDAEASRLTKTRRKKDVPAEKER